MTTPEADWRLTGQEHYLQGKSVRLQRFKIRKETPEWDHEHCDFCWQKIVDDPSKYPRPEELIVDAYVTEDGRHWICPQCFSDFHERFQLTLTT
jgi:hypothetical protein